MRAIGWLLAVMLAAAPQPLRADGPAGWPVAAGDDGATRFSPLAVIDRSNVARLEVAWTYRHGDYRSGWPDPFKGTAFQASPIVVDGRMIFPTPFNRVIALDARRGASSGHSIRRSTRAGASAT